MLAAIFLLTTITVSVIFITVNVIGGDYLRDNVKGGALTEVTFFILLSLYEPRHGYAIMQFIDVRTNSRLILGAGSLYGAINSLLEKKWITLFNNDNDRKKVYIITSLGKEIIQQEIIRLNEVLSIANQITRGESQ